jgi:hypothetical protein
MQTKVLREEEPTSEHTGSGQPQRHQLSWADAVLTNY